MVRPLAVLLLALAACVPAVTTGLEDAVVEVPVSAAQASPFPVCLIVVRPLQADSVTLRGYSGPCRYPHPDSVVTWRFSFREGCGFLWLADGTTGHLATEWACPLPALRGGR